jgi:hypothetical protein
VAVRIRDEHRAKHDLMLQVGIGGSNLLHDVAAAIKTASDKGMEKEMAAGLRRATKPVQAAIVASADRTMPAAGGYRTEFSRSLRFRNTIRTGSRNALVRLTTYAEGAKERRDILRLEAGQLRHPVFGRSRQLRSRRRVPSPWAVTTITPGFWRRGTDNAADAAAAEMRGVLDDFAARIARG